MDKFRIDGHKLMYHTPRVNDWLKGKLTYPIYAEISPSGTCNHRCVYCALDFMNYKPRFLNTELFKKRLSEMGTLGLKSVMYAGEGEPLLHKDIGDLILHTKKVGIDVGITTNGVLLDESVVDKALESITWIKVSKSGATNETYKRIHRTNPEDLNRVMKNIRYAVKLKNDNNYKTTLGIQILLLPENLEEIPLLAEKAKEIGVDYLVVKPYSQHPLSKTKVYENIEYQDMPWPIKDGYNFLQAVLEDFNDKNFNVIFRAHTMEKWDKRKRNYKTCQALPFWSYIDAGGDIWGCSCYLTDKRFYYGNIYKNTFKDIWKGEQRRKSLQWVDSKLDTSKCRVNCRMDEINEYLSELKNPPDHVNFI